MTFFCSGSYYYDTETGFYYLQSRYYDPALGRFLNADSYSSTGQGFLGYNMFAYCNNEPVASTDPAGHYMGHRPIMVNDSYYEAPPIEVSVIKGSSLRRQTGSNKFYSSKYYCKCSTNANKGFLYYEDTQNEKSDILGLIGTYNELRKIAAGTGYEVHHLIEKRFYYYGLSSLYSSTGTMPSAIVTHEEHVLYTNAWRSAYPYGHDNYGYYNIDSFREFVIDLYGIDHPEWISYLYD